MIRISIYAEQTVRAGQAANCDEDCTSDDHVHWEYESPGELAARVHHRRPAKYARWSARRRNDLTLARVMR